MSVAGGFSEDDSVVLPDWSPERWGTGTVEDSRASRLALAGWRASDPLPGGSVTESGTSPPDPTETEEKSDSMPAARFTPRAGVMADGEISATVRSHNTTWPLGERREAGKIPPSDSSWTMALSSTAAVLFAHATTRQLVVQSARGVRCVSARARCAAAATSASAVLLGGGVSCGS